MDAIVIAPVTDNEIALLDGALRKLSADLGDAYLAGRDALAAAVCGPGSGCFALLATREASPVGALLAAPLFSTVQGGSGLFVTDLWVAESVRRRGLARRLMTAALREGARRNTALFMKLAVYHDNPDARAVYERLGFVMQPAETNMTLVGHAIEKLKATR